MERACESGDHLGLGSSVIDVARRQAKGQQLTLVINEEVELDARKPTDRGLAACGLSGKDLVLAKAWMAAREMESRKLMPL